MTSNVFPPLVKLILVTLSLSCIIHRSNRVAVVYFVLLLVLYSHGYYFDFAESFHFSKKQYHFFGRPKPVRTLPLVVFSVQDSSSAIDVTELLLLNKPSESIKLLLNKNNAAYRDLIRKVDHEHCIDAGLAPFAIEVGAETPVHSADFSQTIEEIISPVTGRAVAVRSTPLCPPLLNATSIQALREAAERLWEEQRQSNGLVSSSRFTYQLKNNWEAHVQDLFQFNPHLQHIMDELLLHKVYPILRYSFGHNGSNDTRTNYVAPLSKENFPSNDRTYKLSVYDSLLIRYNATGDKESSTAGQPFHRDLGLCSMNIALNPPAINNMKPDHGITDLSFVGGGTFFENLVQIRNSSGTDNNSAALLLELQMINDRIIETNNAALIRPRRAGEFVAHPCSERHAGVVTTNGIRDILVIFVTAQHHPQLQHENDIYIDDNSVTTSTLNRPSCPTSERVARLKGQARFAATVEDKQLCYHAALLEDPNDGEAWQFLGMSLLYDGDDIESAIRCLENAKHHSPNDSRVYNNLGVAYMRQRQKASDASVQSYHDDARIEECFTRSLRLSSIAVKSGVMTIDYESALLNLGIFYAGRDDFSTAYNVLSLIANEKEERRKQALGDSHHYSRVVHDSELLLDLCRDRIGLVSSGKEQYLT
jgi:tetratricopeptide (TPR) repeat protein